jgi:hypothetical protein
MGKGVDPYNSTQVDGSYSILHQPFDFGPIRREFIEGLDEDSKFGTSNCVFWPSEDRDYFFDTPLHTSFVSGYITHISAVIALVILACMSCCSAPDGMIAVLFGLFIVSTFFQLLGFVAFHDDFVQDQVDGTLGPGAYIAIVVVILSVLATAVVARIMRKMPRHFDNSGDNRRGNNHSRKVVTTAAHHHDVEEAPKTMRSAVLE